MAKVRLKGLNVTRKKLADGSVKLYYYAWRNGPRIEAEFGTPEFIIEFNAAHTSRREQLSRTLSTLVGEYANSHEFKALSERTRHDYRRLLNQILDSFHDFPLTGAASPKAREIFLEWRDELAEHSLRQADYAWTVLARLFSWGLQRRKVSANPCEKAGRLYRGSRSAHVWTEEQEAAFLASAPEGLRLALLLGLWTGQRQGDLLRLPWSAYDGSTIRLTQRKSVRQGNTKFATRVVVPVGAPLKAALDEAAKKKVSTVILVNSYDKPWTEWGFRASWQRACKKAGVEGVTFHDLRGTAVTRLALAGCTEAEIASITGHKMGDVRHILDAHYLQRNPDLSVSAIRKLELERKKKL